jgi:hypothetical protein
MGAIRPTALIFDVGQNAIVIGAVKQKVRLGGAEPTKVQDASALSRHRPATHNHRNKARRIAVGRETRHCSEWRDHVRENL